MTTTPDTPIDVKNDSSEFVIPRSQWRRVFLVAVALPVLLTVFNEGLSAGLATSRSVTFVVLAFSIYVVEMALIAKAAGAGIRQTWLACVLFAWLLQMINLHLIVAAFDQSIAWRNENGLSTAAVAAAQMGFLAVWAVLGTGRWYLRVPYTSVIAGLILYGWYYFADICGNDQWTSILIIELVSISFLSIVLRLAGFRLYKLDELRDDGALSHMQFGLRHVLILTTALAVLLGFARAAQMLTLPFFMDTVRSLKLWRITIACPSAILVVLAFWAALGKGSVWLRTLLITLGCLAIGFGMAAWSWYMLDLRISGTGFNWMSSWESSRFWRLRYWWIAWFCLSIGLLSACLLFFRSRGYRIIRRSRRHSPN